MTKKKSTPPPNFKLGEYVRLPHSSYGRARIVGLRGPFGPGGVEIYRIRVGPKGNRSYFEVRADQLEPLPPED